MTQDQCQVAAPGVSEATEAALRRAMERLITGRPQITDGRLTKHNLWKEAGVSRATMNRAPGVLAEWVAHVTVHGARTSGEAQRDEQIEQLRRRLAVRTAQ